jgi:integrase
MTRNEPVSESNAYEKVGEFVAIFPRGEIWYVNCQHGHRQTRRSLKTRSKKEARRKALVVEKEILAGEHCQPRRAPLLTDAVASYLDHLRSEGRSSKTMAKYEFCFALLLDVAARRRIRRLDQLDLQLVDQFRAERAAGGPKCRPAKPKTIHNDTVTVRQLVNFALQRRLIADDPLVNLKLAKPKRSPQPCWTREQVDRILQAAEMPHRAVLTFLAETGTRVGEAKWLTWEDIDIERRLVHIRPKVGWSPKSRDQRAVPISDSLYTLLSSLPRCGVWVFPARRTARHPEADRQFSERRLLQYLKRLLKRLGLKGHLHAFRHSFISLAAIHGVSERVLRAWVGHVDREVLDWYFHLADEQSVGAMRRLTRTVQARETGQETESDSAHFQHNLSEDENESIAT